jgi:hypothetical protein
VATEEDDTPTPDFAGKVGPDTCTCCSGLAEQIGVVVVLPPPTARVSVATACLQYKTPKTTGVTDLPRVIYSKEIFVRIESSIRVAKTLYCESRVETFHE